MRGVRHINAILKRAQRSFTHGYATDSRAVSAAGEFWSSVQVQDLPESSPELEIARRHNSSLPYRPELIVQGSIVHVDRDHVTVDTGLRCLQAMGSSTYDTRIMHLTTWRGISVPFGHRQNLVLIQEACGPSMQHQRS